jgi:hypothetical protein
MGKHESYNGCLLIFVSLWICYSLFESLKKWRAGPWRKTALRARSRGREKKTRHQRFGAADQFAGASGGVTDRPKLVCRRRFSRIQTADYYMFDDSAIFFFLRNLLPFFEKLRLCYLSLPAQLFHCACPYYVASSSNLLCCFSLPRTPSVAQA